MFCFVFLNRKVETNEKAREILKSKIEVRESSENFTGAIVERNRVRSASRWREALRVSEIEGTKPREKIDQKDGIFAFVSRGGRRR